MQLSIVDKDKRFKFKCRRCGFCCDNTVIYLYPFDIRNICSALDISTQDLHKAGFTRFIIDKQGIPRCILNNKGGCRFRDNDKCSIYDSRPLRCRLFPVGRYFEKGRIEYLLPKQQCMGFDTGRKQSVREYLEEQGTAEFDELAARWNNYIIGMREKPKDMFFAVIFRKVFYDFDDRLIKGCRQKLRKEDSPEDLMENLYTIAEEMLG